MLLVITNGFCFSDKNSKSQTVKKEPEVAENKPPAAKTVSKAENAQRAAATAAEAKRSRVIASEEWKERCRQLCKKLR